MAIILALADANDGTLEASTWKHAPSGVVTVPASNEDFQDDARRGEGAVTEGGNTPETGQRLKIGGQMWNNNDQTNRYEAFVLFTPAGGFAAVGDAQQEVVTSALRVSRKALSYSNPNDSNFGAKDSMGIWTKDWSGDVSPSMWFDLMSISGQGTGSNYQPEAELSAWTQDRSGANEARLFEGGGEVFWTKVRDKLAAGLPIGHVLLTWTSTQPYPGSYLWVVNLTSANDVLTPPKMKPTLLTRTQKKHALNSVGGASVQMSDGTAVFLRHDTVTGRYNLYYQKVNQTSPTLIDYLRSNYTGFNNAGGDAQYFGYEPAHQAFSLTRDTNDNLYITGPRGNPQTGTYGQKVANVCCFKYLGNFAWQRWSQTTTGENSFSTTDTHRGLINNTQAIWVPNGSTPSGTLAMLHSRRDGQWSRYQTGVSTISAAFLTGGSSAINGVAYAGSDDLGSTEWWRSSNPTGSNLDGFRDGSTLRMAGGISALGNGDNERTAAMVSTVATNGSVSKPQILSGTVRAEGINDPDGKVRAVWLGDNTQYWAIARYGLVTFIKKSDGSVFREVDFTSINITNFPSRSALQGSQAWDVVVDTAETNWVWHYYRDSANPRLIRKVRYNYVDHVINPSQLLTVDPIGEPGSSILALRMPRQQIDGRCLLVDVAMQLGSGLPAPLITIRDTGQNRAPGKPTVDPISPFNATSTKAVNWTFQDANPSDFATFQDIEIQNVATGITTHSASHVAVTSNGGRGYRYTIPSNVLTNDAAYRFRVASYDAANTPSPWSDWIGFSTTSTGGSVTITEPATDNEPLNRSSLEVKWTYTNTNPARTQTGYRVRVFNAETGATVIDSNLVTSTNKFHTITGLTSDIQYRVEVQVQDSASQLSGSGMRLIFPDFNNPSLPEITAEPRDGYIEIRVTNPPPTGENPITQFNQIARKETTESDDMYKVIGECPPNSTYQDWTVASGVEYVYKARGSSE